jgi:hypothetical protein
VRWGFTPGWVKDPKEFPLLINARSETAIGKASFKRSHAPSARADSGLRFLRMASAVEGERRGLAGLLDQAKPGGGIVAFAG